MITVEYANMITVEYANEITGVETQEEERDGSQLGACYDCVSVFDCRDCYKMREK